MPLRTLDDQSILDRFLELRAEKKRIEEELERLKPEILSSVIDEPEMRGTHNGFEFTVQYRKYWDYSDHVAKLTEELKATKHYEEAHDIATVKKSVAVLYCKAAR